MIYILKGDPIPLARPRFSKDVVYDSQKNQRMYYRSLLAYQHDGSKMEGPLHLNVIYFMPIPISISKVAQQKLIGKIHKSRPDLDNLIKWTNDICNGILFHDDSSIARITATKVYGINTRTEFSLTRYNPEVDDIGIEWIEEEDNYCECCHRGDKK